MDILRTFWRGETDLKSAFWSWVILGGLIVNLSSSLLFLTFIVRDLPWVALVLGYAYSLPYNAVAMVGLWRSAGRYDGPDYHADLARSATVLLLVGLSVT